MSHSVQCETRFWSFVPHTPGFFYMIRKLLLIILLIVFTFLPTTQAQAVEFDLLPTQQMEIEAKILDPRAMILRDYLSLYDSPLKNNAQDFIEAADLYKLDWKLVPAIAGVESTFGKHSIGKNAWGWGVYGNQAILFPTWKDGIYTVTRGLKESYFDRGLTNPYTINRVYAASPAWGWKVSYFMSDLENFAKSRQPILEASLDYQDVEAKTFKGSAKLAILP